MFHVSDKLHGGRKNQNKHKPSVDNDVSNRYCRMKIYGLLLEILKGKCVIMKYGQPIHFERSNAIIQF